jgi:hypothetical protein
VPETGKSEEHSGGLFSGTDRKMPWIGRRTSMQLKQKGTVMKRMLIVMLSLAAAGSFAILQAHEDAATPHSCGGDCAATLEDGCCCGGSVDGCEGDCSSCDECGCDSECEEECDETACTCDECTHQDELDDEEEVEAEPVHCGGCH